MKKVTGFFTRGLPFGEELRAQIFHEHTIESIYDFVKTYFERLSQEGLEQTGFANIHNAARVEDQLDQRQEKYAVYAR